ncbi:hypothetical protein FF011L_42000 [Roseimaritima multifibrata]|uniref:Uncharacterized protein n=1 Tax=Roseimaritima multifibrata TaxID=1930274 RepID=A0A517MKK7_9BACT|nr:hypothetical protein FF011L_42000 [Roseimaritima multifibrata]
MSGASFPVAPKTGTTSLLRAMTSTFFRCAYGDIARLDAAADKMNTAESAGL